MPLPSQRDNPKGFHARYIVTHADGSPTDPNAVYLVLRLDNGGSDSKHIEAGRAGAAAYVAYLAKEAPNHLVQMRKELQALINSMAAPQVGEFAVAPVDAAVKVGMIDPVAVTLIGEN